MDQPIWHLPEMPDGQSAPDGSPSTRKRMDRGSNFRQKKRWVCFEEILVAPMLFFVFFNVLLSAIPEEGATDQSLIHLAAELVLQYKKHKFHHSMCSSACV